MTPEQFCYWLQGRAELVKEPPSAEEWESIKQHLALVFHKVTPPAPGTSPLVPVQPVIDPSVIDAFKEWSRKHHSWNPPYTITCDTDVLMCASANK